MSQIYPWNFRKEPFHLMFRSRVNQSQAKTMAAAILKCHISIHLITPITSLFVMSE